MLATGETVETVADFYFSGLQITADGDCSHEIKRRLLLGRKVTGTWDLSGPGTEAVFLHWECRALTTGPPGKFDISYQFKNYFIMLLKYSKQK